MLEAVDSRLITVSQWFITNLEKYTTVRKKHVVTISTKILSEAVIISFVVCLFQMYISISTYGNIGSVTLAVLAYMLFPIVHILIMNNMYKRCENNKSLHDIYINNGRKLRPFLVASFLFVVFLLVPSSIQTNEITIFLSQVIDDYILNSSREPLATLSFYFIVPLTMMYIVCTEYIFCTTSISDNNIG